MLLSIKVQAKVIYTMFQKFIALLFFIVYSYTVFADGNYQVDLIIFAASNSPPVTEEDSAFIPICKEAIHLRSSKPSPVFRLLNTSASSLNNEYYLLKHTSAYKVLGHYSWKQPKNTVKTVALPKISKQGWEIRGTVRIQQNNYYNLDTDLQCTSSQNPAAVFTVKQKQRLTADTVYYLDHPQLRMLVKIHA